MKNSSRVTNDRKILLNIPLLSEESHLIDMRREPLRFPIDLPRFKPLNLFLEYPYFSSWFLPLRVYHHRYLRHSPAASNIFRVIQLLIITYTIFRSRRDTARNCCLLPCSSSLRLPLFRSSSLQLYFSLVHNRRLKNAPIVTRKYSLSNFKKWF